MKRKINCMFSLAQNTKMQTAKHLYIESESVQSNIGPSVHKS